MSDRSLTDNPLIQLVDEVSRLQGRFKTLFADVHRETGLKAMEDLVLNAIVEADKPPTVAQIGRSLGHPRQVIQRAVNDLVDSGFLAKQANPDHKRAPLFALTTKGEALKIRSNRKALAIADAFLRSIPSQQCQQLANELKAVRKAMESFARTQADDQ
ncbi:helix-turn-helix domain-containing protein [Halioxenophilus sp. WMMB6]|uniref:MarR family winged helix-turn-helix transcriptional regulator n=1 Tax=Halioxenophilus sp. WMMB6 TaxID=3073815 RepID=UPI00295E8D53|nr:helix-turn-helix domain-containing protein [Halioxenophilus sp. WMMB6]